MAIDKKLIDQLLTDYKKPEDIIGENGLLKELTKAILERALQAEMTDHLGYEKHDPAGHHRGNSRNGKSQKTLKGDFGELELETPRDRKATFDPKIVAKDISLPGISGIEAARRIRRLSPNSRIIFLSQHDSWQMVEDAVRAGGHGYVAKMDAGSELLKAIRAVREGKRFVSERIVSQGWRAEASW